MCHTLPGDTGGSVTNQRLEWGDTDQSEGRRLLRVTGGSCLTRSGHTEINSRGNGDTFQVRTAQIIFLRFRFQKIGTGFILFSRPTLANIFDTMIFSKWHTQEIHWNTGTKFIGWLFIGS